MQKKSSLVLAMTSDNQCDDDMSSRSTAASVSTMTIDDCPVPDFLCSDDNIAVFSNNDVFRTETDVYD